MQAFTYSKASSVDEALKSPARFLSGGTSLIDLMKLDVERPTAILDVNALPLNKIERTNTGLHIGAAVRNSDLAHDGQVVSGFPVLSKALLSGASAQLRNKATTAGNLLQRTRCLYFRDASKACNKRDPGTGCAAIGGYNRNLAILGTSAKCIANNPSDMNVALMALEAKIHLLTKDGPRDVPIGEFFLLPGDTPHIETILKPHELITGVSLTTLPNGARSTYLKLRDRQSYEFALASVAIIASVRDHRFDHIRIAFGGIGAQPWRSLDAEKVLAGAAVSPAAFQAAADAALKNAKPQSLNGFKVELAKRALIAALTLVTKA